jgi:AraC family transcriptional regulator
LTIGLRASGFSVGSWRCQNPLRAIGSEEYTSRHEIVLHRAGSYVRHRGSRDRAVADPTVMFLANPGDGFRVSHPDCSGDQCTVFFLSADLVAQMLGDPCFPVSTAPVTANTYAEHRRLIGRLEDDAADSLELQEAALQMLGRIAAEVSDAAGASRPSDGPTPQRERVEALKLVMAARFRERLTLVELAAVADLSPYYTTRLFRAAAGMPLHRYLLCLRLRAGLEHLAAGERNLSRLALDLGFSSHSHFTNAFRKEFGCSPSVWRGGFLRRPEGHR